MVCRLICGARVFGNCDVKQGCENLPLRGTGSEARETLESAFDQFITHVSQWPSARVAETVADKLQPVVVKLV